MGSNMRPAIFNERVAMALRKWHQTARKNVKESHRCGTGTPPSSRPATPRHSGLSPVHLLRHSRSDVDSQQVSPRFYNSSPARRILAAEGSSSHKFRSTGEEEAIEQEVGAPAAPVPTGEGHVIDISSDFSFDKRERKA